MWTLRHPPIARTTQTLPSTTFPSPSVFSIRTTLGGHCPPRGLDVDFAIDALVRTRTRGRCNLHARPASPTSRAMVAEATGTPFVSSSRKSRCQFMIFMSQIRRWACFAPADWLLAIFPPLGQIKLDDAGLARQRGDGRCLTQYARDPPHSWQFLPFSYRKLSGPLRFAFLCDFTSYQRTSPVRS